jgi:hypothetical protein
VLYGEHGYDTIIEVKNMILKEETINSIDKPERKKQETKDTEIATAIFEGVCHFCQKKRHRKLECFAFKKLKAGDRKPAASYWCDICYKEGHSTDYCSANPINKGKDKVSKGKAKGNIGTGKGKGGK